ncbi:MAG: dihydroorotase [Methanobacteriota archaeon]|nr:MAG: dihydroorotase [Euryarchaeota archaeon]
MSSMDVVVKGKCYVEGRLYDRCIGVVDGRIAAIGANIDGERVYDFGGKLILPSAVDAHVHMRDPGATHKEDFATGSLAALHGGVTCVMDMPNTDPPTTTVAALREKANIAAAKSYSDFGLFAGVAQGCDPAALSAGVIGFKMYMAGTTGNLHVPSLESIRNELAEVASTGKVLAVHAENEALRGKGAEKSLGDHLRNRPNECETSAIRKLNNLAVPGLKTHVCHVSAKESLRFVSKSKERTFEVTPHHLLLDQDSKLSTYGKVNPPLRNRRDRQALFNALKEDLFTIVASDHAPHTIEEKEEDFDFAPCGMPGVETIVPLMLQLVRDRHISIQTFVRVLCERPAELFGLNKGRLCLYRDADIMIVDLMKSTEIKADRLHSRCAWTPYEGMSGIFPKAVFLRGEIMIEDGAWIGERAGRNVVESQRKPVEAEA